MTSIEVLFYILSCVINGSALRPGRLTGLAPSVWQEVYELASRQGLTAVCFEPIKNLPLEVTPPREVTLKWLLHAMKVEKVMKQKASVCREFATLIHNKGLELMVLKGMAVADYYPQPYHREFGDLDCYVYKRLDASCATNPHNGNISWSDGFERTNEVAKETGAKVECGHYKHSHIFYKGLEVENHCFSLPVRDSDNMKALERHLRRIVEKEPPIPIGDSYLLKPSPTFNALFLTAHAMTHFLYERIHLRHVMDWALFVSAEKDNIDWDDFNYWSRLMHYDRFVECLNVICNERLGCSFPVTGSSAVKALAGRVLDDIFTHDTLYNKGFGRFRIRWELLRGLWNNRWKFTSVYQHSLTYVAGSLLKGVLLDRKPQL